MPSRNITSVPDDSAQSGADLAPDIDPSLYSADHHEHIALLRPWAAMVKAQEDAHVAAGHPAEGITEFLVTWFEAFRCYMDSAKPLRDLVTDDLTWTEPVFGSRTVKVRQIDFDLYYIGAKWTKDAVFYPRSLEPQHLPYWDFTDGVVRIALPWRAIYRGKGMTSSAQLVGVDRYTLVRDAADKGWLVKIIDSEFDLSMIMGQLIPFFHIKGVNERLAYAVVKAVTTVFPRFRSNVRPFLSDKA